MSETTPGTLGPRPRAFSAHPDDAVVAMVRKPMASSMWLGQLGLLFHTSRMIAAYIPSRKVITYPVNLSTRKLRHVSRWRQELHCEMHADDAFFSNALAEISSMASLLDATYFPSRKGT